MEHLIFTIICVIIFAVGVPLLFYLGKRRQQGLEWVAQEMGFSFEANPASLEAEGFLELPLLKRNTGLTDVLRGAVASGEAVVLDVRTGGGRGAMRRTVALFRLAGKRLPVFELRPEHLFDKLGAAFGYKDINFESNPKFSRRYLLRGPDEGAVRELFHHGRLMFFEQNKGWCVEGAGEWLAVYRPARMLSHTRVRTFLEDAGRVVTAFD